MDKLTVENCPLCQAVYYREPSHFHTEVCPNGHSIPFGVRVTPESKIASLEADLEAVRNHRDDTITVLVMIAKALGVEHEPHQSFTDRLLEAASDRRVQPAEPDESVPTLERLEWALMFSLCHFTLEGMRADVKKAQALVALAKKEAAEADRDHG